MIVLIKNIPESSYHNNISDLLEPVVKGNLLTKKGEVSNIEIIALQEINRPDLEFQALATIQPDDVGQRVIKKLHGLYLQGRRVVVRQYFIRSWRNDKRSQETQPLPPHIAERRKISCRRRKLKMFKIAVPDFM